MEAGVVTSRRSQFVRRSAPIGCGGVVAASAAFLASHEPGTSGVGYPGCVFHQMTGLWCPGCGLTRGTFALMHGHIGSALGYNLFTPAVLVAIAVAWLAWMSSSWDGPTVRLSPIVTRRLAATLPTLVLAYGVARNLPLAALRPLAP
jgi:hypothetical protein